MTALITWYRQPMDQLTGHFINNVYDFEVAPRGAVVRAEVRDLRRCPVAAGR
jgi:hypothetical protein